MPKPSSDTALVEKIAQKADPVDWTQPEVGEAVFGTNQVLAAYRQGQESAIQDALEMMDEIKERNIDRSAIDTNKVVQILKSHSLVPVEARLHVLDWTQFEVMVLLQNGDTSKPSMLEIYEFVGELIAKEANKFYNIVFRFLDKNERLDMTKVIADGFNRVYLPLSGSSR